MPGAEQRKKFIVAVSAALVVSVGLTAWVIYAAQTRRYLLLARYGWLFLLLGVVLVALSVLLGSMAFRSHAATGEIRAVFALRAISCLLFGLASLVHVAFGDYAFLSAVRAALHLAVALIFISFLISVFSLRRKKRDRVF